MLSGREWANRFPTSTSIRDLGPGFRPRIERFISSLESGGARVRINATTRPPERAYLMHYAWRIARENLSPDKVPDMPGGVRTISWTTFWSSSCIRTRIEFELFSSTSS